jgi:hypothetical protein
MEMWEYHVFDNEPDEWFYELSVGAHYLWVSPREAGGWSLAVCDEAAEALVESQCGGSLAVAQQAALWLYAQLCLTWLNAAMDAMGQQQADWPGQLDALRAMAAFHAG